MSIIYEILFSEQKYFLKSSIAKADIQFLWAKAWRTQNTLFFISPTLLFLENSQIIYGWMIESVTIHCRNINHLICCLYGVSDFGNWRKCHKISEPKSMMYEINDFYRIIVIFILIILITIVILWPFLDWAYNRNKGSIKSQCWQIDSK